MTMLFDLLADPSRRRLVALLRTGERSVGELVERTGASQPAVSKQLRILRNAGVVAVRADGQRRLYRLRPEPFRELDAWLEPYRLVWSSRLDELERHLDAEADERPGAKRRTHRQPGQKTSKNVHTRDRRTRAGTRRT